MEDDDDFYDPTDATPGLALDGDATNSEVRMADVEEGEEGEDGAEYSEEGDDDSEVEFITTAKEQPKAESKLTQPKAIKAANIYTSRIFNNTIRTYPIYRSKSKNIYTVAFGSTPSNDRPGISYPAHHTSTVDPNANPVHPVTGKPIQSTDFDADFPSESSKPWRKPGSDITDYFNYGFDEFTWASYCLKQQSMPKEVAEIKQQAEGMKAFVEGIGGPGAATTAPSMAPNGSGGGGMPPMPGMPSEAEMQQMFGSMMAQGINPSTMDPNQFMQMMMSGGMGGANNQDGGFGSSTPSGPAAQGMGFGGGGAFDQRGGNFAGRGRGRGRW